MKYYVYVSQKKLEMLHGQIELSKTRKREASFGFDIKLLKGEIKESRELNDSVYAKLGETVAQLDAAGLIGTLRSQSHPFIRGSCEMIWATYGSRDDSGITFWAHARNGLVLALAGSKFHVLGEQREGHASSHSLTEAIASWIYSNVAEPFPEQEVDRAKYFSLKEHLEEYDVANGLWLAVTQARGQRSKFEFVAKVLHRSKWPNGFRDGRTKRILLASPLYVSLDQ